MKKNNKDHAKLDLATIDGLEITPLSDEELDSVAGGFTDNTTVASCSCCASGATNHTPNLPQ
jgi:hypothetical protein